jgi:Tfp pilus assembly protein PilF
VINPLAYTPEIAEATRKATAGVVTTLEKLDRIQDYLFDPASAFTYDFVGTLTAAEAFEDRRGNCVAFTNLFIAMSRSAGIQVQAALVSPRGGAEETDGDLALVKNHIVALYRHAAGSTVYDFYTSRTGAPISVRPIDDLWSAAIYINNMGVQALRADDLELALVRFNMALRLAPAYAPVYGNVGVVRRRMGDTDGAFDSYLLALLIEPHNSTIRRNLFQTLEENAQNERDALERAEPGSPEANYRRLALRGAEALLKGEVRDARSAYKRAWREDRARAAPVVAMARCELLMGNPEAARKKLGNALALDPDQPSARRLIDSIERIFLTTKKGKRRHHETDVVEPRPGWSPDRLGRDSGDLL